MDPLLLWLVERDHTTTAVFRGIAGDICLRHHFRRLMVTLINQRDTRAGADPVQPSFPREVIVIDGVNQPSRDIARAFEIAVRQQETKLIPAQTRQNIAGAKHGQHEG